jgi:hypothetical protein
MMWKKCGLIAELWRVVATAACVAKLVEAREMKGKPPVCRSPHLIRLAATLLPCLQLQTRKIEGREGSRRSRKDLLFQTFRTLGAMWFPPHPSSVFTPQHFSSWVI